MPTIIHLSNGKTIELINGKTTDGLSEDEAIAKALNIHNKTASSLSTIFVGFSEIALAMLPYYIRKVPLRK
jgi:hypothetical protein